MPGEDGIEATRRILAQPDSARVLMLTTFDLDEYVYDALRAGASGFLLKDMPGEEIVIAVRQAATRIRLPAGTLGYPPPDPAVRCQPAGRALIGRRARAR